MLPREKPALIAYAFEALPGLASRPKRIREQRPE